MSTPRILTYFQFDRVRIIKQSVSVKIIVATFHLGLPNILVIGLKTHGLEWYYVFCV
jgi:hypothetical protein